MAVHRPDFTLIGKLIGQLRTLETDFERIFEEAQEQEDTLLRCFRKVQRNQSVGSLSEIPVDELKNARAGIRTGALEQAGYHTLLDLYRAKDYELQAVEGIGEKQTASIRTILDEFLNRLAERGRVRLTEDTPGTDAVSSSPEVRELIRQLLCCQQTSLIRRDAQPLRAELAAQIPKITESVEIRSRLGWFFSGRGKKERTILAAAAMVVFCRSPLCTRAEHFVQAYRAAAETGEEAALEDFRRSSASYYAMLEKLSGAQVPQEMIYSSIPAQLAARISAHALDLTGFKGVLRAYQDFGARYILEQKRVLLGDEMGLGKTIQAIAAMAHLHAEDKKSRFLVVCPASVLINWCREIEKFSDVEPHLLHGSDIMTSFGRWKENGGAAVTNYESLGRLVKEINDRMKLSMMVIDEAHYIKNPQAQRTKRIHTLEDESERILMMTGTPLENRVDEMCELIGFVRPDLVGEIRKYAGMHRAPVFREILAPVYLRRRREQVLDELPPVTMEEEWCVMTPQDAAAYGALVLENNFTGMRRVSFLQEDIHTSSKAQRLAELCAEARSEGRKVVVYSYFRETIRKVLEILRERQGAETQVLQDGQHTEGGILQERAGQEKASGADPRSGSASTEGGIFLGEITGSTPVYERQAVIDRFAGAPDGSVLVCQVQAGGIGLNLQAAGVVIFCEPQIKPSLMRQAFARVYRMGQVQHVLVYHLLCENTVDEAVMRIMEEKQEEFDLFADASVLADAADDIADKEWIRAVIEEERRKYLPAPINTGSCPQLP